MHLFKSKIKNIFFNNFYAEIEFYKKWILVQKVNINIPPKSIASILALLKINYSECAYWVGETVLKVLSFNFLKRVVF